MNTNGLCVIGRADACGLGTHTEEFCKAMRPERLVVIVTGREVNPACVQWSNRVTFLPISQFRREHPRSYLTGMKTVVGFETWYRDDFVWQARPLGVRTVMFPMWEWTPPSGYQSDELICLSNTDYEFCDTQRETFTVSLQDWPRPDLDIPAPTWPPRTFVHAAGHAAHNRNGTREVLLAAGHLKGTGAKLVVYSQFDAAAKFEHDSDAPIEFRGEARDRTQILTGADCCVYPRRLPGHSLPINEALGCGIPTITLDLPDWQTQAAYRVTPVSQAPEKWGTQPRAQVWRADPSELGHLMRAMAEGKVVKVPQWRPPTWEQFKEWWHASI